MKDKNENTNPGYSPITARQQGHITVQHTLLLTSLLLGRNCPMAPHHASAIREILGYKTDDELRDFISTGKIRTFEK